MPSTTKSPLEFVYNPSTGRHVRRYSPLGLTLQWFEEAAPQLFHVPKKLQHARKPESSVPLVRKRPARERLCIVVVADQSKGPKVIGQNEVLRCFKSYDALYRLLHGTPSKISTPIKTSSDLVDKLRAVPRHPDVDALRSALSVPSGTRMYICNSQKMQAPRQAQQLETWECLLCTVQL